MNNELLPIGSVVQIAERGPLLMIMGYLPITESRPGYVWDYSGVPFPIGFDLSGNAICFDHDQVKVVYAHGYKDIEEEIFMSKIDEIKRLAVDSLTDSNGDSTEDGKGDDR